FDHAAECRGRWRELCPTDGRGGAGRAEGAGDLLCGSRCSPRGVGLRLVLMRSAAPRKKRGDDTRRYSRQEDAVLLRLVCLHCRLCPFEDRWAPSVAYFLSNGKITFQSVFMSTTVQPRASASSSALSSRPNLESRS